MTLARAAILGLLLAAFIAAWHFAATEEVESVRPSGDETSNEEVHPAEAAIPPEESLPSEGASQPGGLAKGLSVHLAVDVGGGSRAEFSPGKTQESAKRIRVRVLGSADLPLAGAEVVGRDPGGKRQTEATDRDGWATLARAGEGVPFLLTARASGYVAGQVEIEGGGQVVFRLAEEVVLDGRLAPHALEKDLPEAQQLPLNGATVSWSSNPLRFDPDASTSTTADEEGRFQFSTGTDFVWFHVRSASGVESYEMLNVGYHRLRGLPLVVEMPWLGSLLARTRAADGGAPSTEVEVRVFRVPAGPALDREGLSTALARASSRLGRRRYEVPKLLDGLPLDADLVAVAIPRAMYGENRPHAASWPSAPFRLTRAAPQKQLEFVLRRSGSAAIRLVNESGEAIRTGAVETMDMEDKPIATAPGVDGLFRLHGLSPGSRLLEVRSPLAHTTTSAVQIEEGKETLLEIRVRCGVRLAGTVRDARGLPIPRARVEIYSGEATKVVRAVTADAEGRFDVGALPEGPLRLRAEAEGMSTVGEGTVVDGSARDLGLTIQAFGHARLRLSTDDGRALPAEAEVVHGDATERWSGTVPIRDGVLEIDGFVGSEEQVVVDAGDYAPLVLHANVARGEMLDLGTAVLRSGHALVGTVVDSGGKPVRGARVVAAGGRATAVSDVDGKFRLEKLPSGKIDVVAHAADCLETPAIEIEVGRETPPLRLVLSRGAVLVGRLAAADGEPAGGVRLVVHAIADDGSVRPDVEPVAFRTDDDGTFRLVVTPGRLRVEASEGPKQESVLLRELTLEGAEQVHLALALPPK